MKERYFWIIVVLLLAIINFATIYTFSSPTDIISAYNYYPVFQEAFQKVQDNYVNEEKTDTRNLIYGAIEGMLTSLDDEHTAF